jgi:hypothetical protein
LVGYLSGGVPASLPFNWDVVTGTRAAVNKRTVRFTLTAAGQIQVDISTGGGAFTTYIPLTALSTFPTQPAVPSKIRIGFSAATGGSNAIEEIQNLVVS